MGGDDPLSLTVQVQVKSAIDDTNVAREVCIGGRRDGVLQ